MLNENQGVLVTFDESYLLTFYLNKFSVEKTQYSVKRNSSCYTVVINSDFLNGIPTDELLQVHCDIIFYSDDTFHYLEGCVVKPANNTDWQVCKSKQSVSDICLTSISEYDIYPAHFFTVESFNELPCDVKTIIEKVKLGTT